MTFELLENGKFMDSGEFDSFESALESVRSLIGEGILRDGLYTIKNVEKEDEKGLLIFNGTPTLIEIFECIEEEPEAEDIMGNDGELFSIPTGEPIGELFRSDENLNIF